MKKHKLTQIVLIANRLGINEPDSVHIDRICLIHSGLSAHPDSVTNLKELAGDAIRSYERILELLAVKEEKDDSGEGQ